jgi:aryl-alcohol dehydrogenase-like predicted oxidoreductase
MNRIGLGTNRLRNTDDHVAFIRAAVDAGVQIIDTANLYTGVVC